MAAKKKSVARRKKGTAMISMADVEKLMEEDVEEESSRAVAGEGNFISIKGGSFTYQGADIGEEMEVVIVDFANENSYYDGPYNPDEPSSPACWSVSKDKSIDMVPSQDSPKLQCEDCASCWANEYGSADTGRGKACKNSIRLAVVSQDDFDNLDAAEVAFIRVPPTSTKNFNKMSNGVRKVHKRPMYGIISRIKFDDNADYETLLFEPVEPIGDPAVIMGLKELRGRIEDDILMEPDPSNYHEPPAKGPRKKVAKKKGRR